MDFQTKFVAQKPFCVVPSVLNLCIILAKDIESFEELQTSNFGNVTLMEQEPSLINLSLSPYILISFTQNYLKSFKITNEIRVGSKFGDTRY